MNKYLLTLTFASFIGSSVFTTLQATETSSFPEVSSENLSTKQLKAQENFAKLDPDTQKGIVNFMKIYETTQKKTAKLQKNLNELSKNQKIPQIVPGAKNNSFFSSKSFITGMVGAVTLVTGVLVVLQAKQLKNNKNKGFKDWATLGGQAIAFALPTYMLAKIFNGDSVFDASITSADMKKSLAQLQSNNNKLIESAKKSFAKVKIISEGLLMLAAKPFESELRKLQDMTEAE